MYSCRANLANQAVDSFDTTAMSSEGAGGRLQGAPLSIKTNAFHAPKLKRDVMASKLHTKQPADRPGSGSQRQAAIKEAELENMQTGTYEAAGSSPAAVPATSPAPDRSSKPVPATRLTTAKKGKRAKPRTRNSEVTVYYDAVQSPEDAVAKPQQQHKQKQQRGGRAAAAAAAAVIAAVAASEEGTDTAAAAAGADEITAAAWTAEEDDLFPTQPEPMDADYGDQEQLLLPLPDQHNSGSTKVAAGGSKRVMRSSSSDALEEATAAAGRSSRHRNRAEPEDAAAAAAANSPATDDDTDVAAVPASAAQGSQPGRLRDGAEIFKCMQALAEDAAELLPQEQEQKKRGRGRAKKDLRLVDALHQCWQGKVCL